MPNDVTYRDLADGLEALIHDSPPGSRVTSEHELAAEHGVSRPTARAALQELERRFLVRRVRGAGTFTNRRIDYVISADRPPSVTATLLAAGADGTISLVGVEQRPADASLAQRLVIASRSPVTVVIRRTMVDGVVAACSTAHLPTILVPHLEEHLADDVSMFEVLRNHYDLQPMRVWSRASLDVPPPDVAATLGQEARPPAWCLESLNHDRRSSRVVEYTRSWMRADVFNVVFELGSQR